MTEIYNLNKCKYLSEFSQLLGKLEVDTESGGRKFKVFDQDKNETYHYSINDIVFCYEKCVKNSVQNPGMVTDIRTDFDNMIALADKHVEENGSMLCVRQFFGNLWFSMTHCGFNKTQALEDIASAKITGRLDVTTANINDKDAEGNTILHRKILEVGIRPKKLCREIQDLILNGAKPHLENMNGATYLDLAFQEAIKNDQFPLKQILEEISFPQLISMIGRNYKTEAPDSLKSCLAKEIYNRGQTCVHVLNILKEPEAKDFYKMFLEYNSGRELNLTAKDTKGNNLLHYAAKYESIVSVIKKFLAKNFGEIGNWMVKNDAGEAPADLARKAIGTGNAVNDFLCKLFKAGDIPLEEAKLIKI